MKPQHIYTFFSGELEYQSQQKEKKAIEYQERLLKISKEVGDKAGRGIAYSNLRNAYYSLGDFQKAIEYHGRHLKISKQEGVSAGEGRAYGSLGIAYHTLGDSRKP